MILREPCDTRTLSALLESFACPALIVDLECRIRAANAASRRRFSQEGDVSEAYCHELLHGRRHRCSRRRWLCPLEVCAGTGTAVPAIHPHVIGNETQEEQVLLKPIFSEAGRVVACLATLSGDALSGPVMGEGGALARAAVAPVAGRLDRLARLRGPLLLVGERGTGKTAVARAVHRRQRSAGEWEERSGFGLTGDEVRALWARLHLPGRSGTLYLRDVHDLPLRGQDELVAALRSPVSPRTGWRLIAGTDRDLGFLAKIGFFRRELLDCFARRRLKLPPLRERHEELPGIATALLREMGSVASVVTPRALEALRLHPFLGNLEELAQALRHASLLATGGTVDVHHLPDGVVPSPPPGQRDDE